MDILRMKEIIITCNPLDSQGNEKNANSVSIAFSVDILVRNENIISEECKSNNRLK